MFSLGEFAACARSMGGDAETTPVFILFPYNEPEPHGRRRSREPSPQSSEGPEPVLRILAVAMVDCKRLPETNGFCG